MNTTSSLTLFVDEANAWRTLTPGGSDAWDRSPYPNAARKYFMVSTDTHLGPPPTLIRDRIAEEYKGRVTRMERDEDGTLWTIVEGRRPARIVEVDYEGEDLYRSKAGSGLGLESDSNKLDKRMADLDLDGIDAELVFPNGPALNAFYTTDVKFMQAQFRIYNDWTNELTRPYRDRMNVAACIATADIGDAVAEVQRVAKQGFRVVTLPNKPIFNCYDATALNYNSPEFDPLWAALQDADLSVTFHISTGADPRQSSGPGGAVINFAVHAFGSSAEPLVNVIMGGVFDRFPKLRVAVVESGVGWIPWILDVMDEGYRKHHMWTRPKLKRDLPSDYFRTNCGATFGEDRAGMLAVEKFGLEDNFCWANDYPHHEGTFPHSAQAIEREMGDLKEETRAKLLGLNAARLFRFDIPERYR